MNDAGNTFVRHGDQIIDKIDSCHDSGRIIKDTC